ncbi:MAG TPA: 4-hydroxyphenylacetate 3-hydroxylase N-terminal domain-containing protein [Methylomirabilota bacterium]|nr:4-hydroxyphenylacetate 3-hydroxylase N-terminal domain-containing protein [Methylomirabilota bacterium]
MPARTGEDFLKGLKDDRRIWAGDERVRDVVAHPAFAGAARSVAALFDLQHEAPAVCLMPDPETGEPINVSHIIPRSREDLERRHACLERIAEWSVGIMGRTPDYLNATFAGFAGRADEWAMNGNERGAANLVAFQKEIARRDLSLTHTIVQPTIDKSRGDAPSAGDQVALHKVEATAHGIVVRGARILATLAPFSDELTVYPGAPLPVGSDAYALAFSIPMATPGLTFLCRDSYSAAGPAIDHPLSSRFDEQDAFVIFDDVEVPRDRVFIDANLPVYNKVMTTGWQPNIMQQTSIRAQTKLEFAWGVATRMAEAINAGTGTGAEMLGEIWSYAEMTRAGGHSAEQGAYEWGNGVWFPDGRPFRALRALLPLWFPRVNEIIRLLGSHNLLAAPTSAQLADPALRPLIDRFLRGAKDTTAEQRARIFRLAWDFAGSALASRGEQYERFYLASSGRAFIRAQTFASPDRARRLVERFLTEELS